MIQRINTDKSYSRAVNRSGEAAYMDEMDLEVIEISGKDAREIPNYCFCNCRNLREVRIIGKLEQIGICAFSGCTSL